MDDDLNLPVQNHYRLGEIAGRMSAVEARQDRHETWMGKKFESLEAKLDAQNNKLDEVRDAFASWNTARKTLAVSGNALWAFVIAVGAVVGFIINHYWR